MDDVLKKALDFSNYRKTFAIQHKILKEKADSRLTYGFNGGIFKIDRTLITFVQMLEDKGRISGVVLLDVNDTPIMIADLLSFKEDIFDRYFNTTYEYYEEYEKMKKNRNVESLIK